MKCNLVGQVKNPPRAKDIMPNVIINTEAIFDTCESEIGPTIPAKQYDAMT